MRRVKVRAWSDDHVGSGETKQSLLHMTLASLLTTQRIGRDLRYVAEVSTNRDIAALAQTESRKGWWLSLTSRAGRGRMTRVWFSPPGVNLYFSRCCPMIEPGHAASLPLVAGLAVAEALEQTAPAQVPMIKWPNDIEWRPQTLRRALRDAGRDRSYHHITLGIGVNVNLTCAMLPVELRERATSLRIATGRLLARGSAGCDLECV